MVHFHTEAEQAALIYALRVNPDGAAATLYYLLDHGKTQANTLAVDLGRSLQLAEASEELREVLGGDPDPIVRNVHHKESIGVAYADNDGSVDTSKF